MPSPTPDHYETWYPDAPIAAPDVQIHAVRHAKWPTVRARHLARHPQCAACGFTRNLQVHHLVPVSIDFSLELCPANLLTLGSQCPSGNHHFLIGHAQNWQAYIPNAREIAHMLHAQIRNAHRELATRKP